MGAQQIDLLESMMEGIYGSCVQFFFTDVPELLSLFAKALKSANRKIPSNINGWFEMSLQNRVSILSPCSFVVAVLVSLIALGFRSYNCKVEPKPNTYYLTRILLIRGQGLIYLAAFLSSAIQARGIFGTQGLQPITDPHSSGRPVPLFSFFEYLGFEYNDIMLELVCWIGVFFSLVLLLSKTATFITPLLLWTAYLSLVNLGAPLLNYGWEWLTLEVGFLLLFLFPIYPLSLPLTFTHKDIHMGSEPPMLVIWLMRWCAFRLLIGAGQSKIGTRSSDCWLELTCTETHYVTQPMPNGFAWFAHHGPDWFHQAEVALTFVEQLVLPFAMLIPIRWVRILAGIAEIFFQCMIILTGNYAWINFIGILPSFSLFDDGFLALLLPQAKTEITSNEGKKDDDSKQKDYTNTTRGLSAMLSTIGMSVHKAIAVVLFAFICVKSVDPLKELHSASPWLHFYDDYFFVNAQGVFGFINKERTTLLLEYTHAHVTKSRKCVDRKESSFRDNSGNTMECKQLAGFCGHPQHGQGIRTLCPASCGICDPVLENKDTNITWHPLEFKNLPGPDVTRMPSFNSPYHYRLDWEVWIHTTASMEGAKGFQSPPSIVTSLISKILAGDTDAVLLLHTPLNKVFDDHGRPPTAIRASFEKYWYTSWDHLKKTGEWWTRSKIPGERSKIYFRNDFQWKPNKSDKKMQQVRRGVWERHWLLLYSVFGAFMAVRENFNTWKCLPFPKLLKFAVVSCMMITFGLSLTTDYVYELPTMALTDTTHTYSTLMIGLLISVVEYKTIFWVNCILCTAICMLATRSILRPFMRISTESIRTKESGKRQRDQSCTQTASISNSEIARWGLLIAITARLCVLSYQAHEYSGNVLSVRG
eukprot:m.81129 g.81129  ORF g.81129 m.81129 type:complete len:871 (+) comp12791_c0_seq2:263-2875(+)